MSLPYLENGNARVNLDSHFFRRIIADHQQPFSVYAPDPEELSNDILEKLEQAGRVPSKDKFRRMACNTFIYTGACPYNDRCVFLHDHRIRADGVKAKATRQTKVSNLIKDTFYWPDMSHREVMLHLDSQGLADVNQRYQIPDCFGKANANIHNRSIYSLWTHFVAFCMYNRSLKPGVYNNLQMEKYFQDSEFKENRFIKGLQRLPVLYDLSNCEQLQDHNAQFLSAEYDSLADVVPGDPLRTPVRRYEPPVRRGRLDGYETPQGAQSQLSARTDPAAYMRTSRGGESVGFSDLLGLFSSASPQDTHQLGAQTEEPRRRSVSSSASTVSWVRCPMASEPNRLALRSPFDEDDNRVGGAVQVISPTTAAKNDAWLSLLQDSEDVQTETDKLSEEEEGEEETPAWTRGLGLSTNSLGDMPWDPEEHARAVFQLGLEDPQLARQPSTLSSLTAGSMSPGIFPRESALHFDWRVPSAVSAVPEPRLLPVLSFDSLGGSGGPAMILGGQSNTPQKQNRSFRNLDEWFIEQGSFTESKAALQTPNRATKDNSGSGDLTAEPGGYRSFDKEMSQLQVLDGKHASSASSDAVGGLKYSTLSPTRPPTVMSDQKVRASYPPPPALPVAGGAANAGMRSQSMDYYQAQYLQTNTQFMSPVAQQYYPLNAAQFLVDQPEREEGSAARDFVANRHHQQAVGPNAFPFSPRQTPTGDRSDAGYYHIQPPSPLPASPVSRTTPVQVGRYKVELPQPSAAVYRGLGGGGGGGDAGTHSSSSARHARDTREAGYEVQPPSPVNQPYPSQRQSWQRKHHHHHRHHPQQQQQQQQPQGYQQMYR